MSSRDVLDFVVAADCQDAAEEIAVKVAGFTEDKPSEDEVLARCRHVFEYVLQVSLAMTNPQADLKQFEVEIQIEKE